MTDLDEKRRNLFGENVRRIRIKKGLSQDEVAARSRVTKSNLSVIENGKRNFSFSTLLAIAKGLRVHPRELLDIDFELDREE